MTLVLVSVTTVSPHSNDC